VTASGQQSDRDDSGWQYDKSYLALAADGQTIAYTTDATNLGTTPDTNDWSDI